MLGGLRQVRSTSGSGTPNLLRRTRDEQNLSLPAKHPFVLLGDVRPLRAGKTFLFPALIIFDSARASNAFRFTPSCSSHRRKRGHRGNLFLVAYDEVTCVAVCAISVGAGNEYSASFRNQAAHIRASVVRMSLREWREWNRCRSNTSMSPCAFF